MAELEMTETDDGYVVDGLSFTDKASAQRYIQNRKGGSLNLGVVEGLASAIGEGLTGLNMRRKVNRARNARYDLLDTRAAMYAKLDKLDPTGELSLLTRKQDEAQDRLDRNQTAALADTLDMVLVRVGAGGLRAWAAAQMQSGGGGGGGDGGTLGLLAAGGVGALVGAAWDDDDGGRRGRRRDDDEDRDIVLG